MSGRVVRIFLSSTFRDFGEERDLLVRKVFPTLRAKLQSRFVDLVDVDLRWGITEEEAERGEVLPICLSEIERARPFFIGFLGERYGWVPPPDAYPSHVLESQAWLEEHRGGKSVTELEILHGVLNNPSMEGRALFYFRSFEYSSSKGGDYIASSQDDQTRQSALKETIRQSGFPVYEDYTAPEHLAELLEKDLWEILDREFPASDIPDAFVRENLQHEAYEVPRQRLYIGGDKYLTALDTALSQGKQWILVDGPSGGGKSALLANWLQSVRNDDKNIEVHAHYLGATADATDPVFLVRRLIEYIKRKTENTDDIASDPDELFDSLPTWLANASSWCELRDKKLLFVIDALNGLSDRRDLRWFPRMLPKHIHLVISTLPGEVNDALLEKANWSHVSVMPLDATTAELVLTSYLALFNKTLPNELVEQVMAHKLSANPLFLLTLAEELRLFGEHEQLSSRIDHYLTSITVDDLFERVLERIEQDYGADTLREIMTALWAARSGLREEEILGYSGLKPMHWAYIRNALGPTLIDASGRLIFAHDYMRIAVSDRYMAGNNTVGNEGQSEEALNLRQAAHKNLVRWFEKYAFQDGQGIVSNERAAEEIPYQWQQAKDWKELQTALTKQKMLNAILEHRSEQELLSYWLKLEANIKTDIETQYEKAWRKWKLNENENEKDTGDLAEELADFLVHAARYQDFTKRLRSVALKSAGLQTELYSKRKNAYANFFSRVGENDTALMLHQENLELRRTLYEDHSEKISETLNNLGTCYVELNQHDRAVDFFEASLNNFKKTKENYRECVTIEGNLAVAYYHNGDSQNAKRHAVTALSSAETMRLPETHIAILLINYALVSSNDDNELARELYSKAFEISRRLLGDDHEITASSLLGLSGILSDLKQFKEALEMVDKALSSFVRYKGKYNSATFEALNCKAIILTSMDRIEQAAICFEEATNVADHVYHQQDPERLRAIGNAAVALNIAERLEDSVNYFEKFVNNTCKSHPLPNIEVIEYLLGYLAVLRKLKVTRAQIGIINKAYKLACECKSYDFKELTDLFHLLAINLEDINELDAAEAIYAKLLHDAKLLPEIDQSLIAYRLANNLSLQQRYSNAEHYYRLTLAIEERDLGADHADIAITYYNLGKTLAEQAKYLDAEDYFQKTLKIELRELGDDDPDIAPTLLWLGESQFHQAKFDDAEHNLLKALSLQLTQYSEHDIELKHVLELLRDVSIELGKDAEARDYASKVLSLDR